MKKLTKWAYAQLFPPLSWAMISLVSRTLRIQVLGESHLKAVKAQKRPIVWAIWHGRQFLISRYLAYQNTCVLSSPSRDGRLQGAILGRFKYRIIYGSSKKSPVRALLALVSELKTHGGNCVMAVDGPTGPIYKAKPGALFVAKKINAVVVPLTFSAEKGKIFKAWDRYLFPWPFTRAVISIGEPIDPAPDTSQSIIDTEIQVLEERLNQCMQTADNLVNRQDLH